MRLSTAAAYFDRTVCADAYDPTKTFRGQLNLFDDSTRDGTTVTRRVLEVADGIAVPARRAITVHGDQYIIGHDHPDSFNGQVIRRKYVCQRADGQGTVYTPDQLLRSLAGYTLYAGFMWIKDQKEIETSSRISSFVDLFVSLTEAVADGSIVALNGRYYLVRHSTAGAAGFRVLETDELEAACLATAAYSSRAGNAYDPVNDTRFGANSTVPMLVHRWQDEFFYHRMSSTRFENGDAVARVSQASLAAPQPGDTFTFDATGYKVVSVRDDKVGGWILHSRRD